MAEIDSIGKLTYPYGGYLFRPIEFKRDFFEEGNVTPGNIGSVISFRWALIYVRTSFNSVHKIALNGKFTLHILYDAYV